MKSNFKLCSAITILLFITNNVLAKEIENQYLKLKLDPNNGRYVLTTTRGDPSTKTDDNKKLLFERFGEITSYTTLKIDNKTYIFGDTEGKIVRQFSESKRLDFVWEINSIRVSQILSFVEGMTTGREDNLKIEYQLSNFDTKPHRIGLRILLDTMLGSNDGAPFSVPGTGAVTTDSSFTGDKIPIYWYAFDNIREPVVSSLAVIKVPNYEQPNRLIFSNWNRLYESNWDVNLVNDRKFRATPLSNIDSAVVILWDAKPLEFGTNRQYSISYGLHKPVININEYMNVALSCPMKVYSAQQFTVSCDIENFKADNKIQNLTAEIGVKPNNSIEIINNQPKQKVQVLNSGEQNKFFWTLQPQVLWAGKAVVKLTITGELHSSQGIKALSIPVEKEVMVLPVYTEKQIVSGNNDQVLKKVNDEILAINLKLNHIDEQLRTLQ